VGISHLRVVVTADRHYKMQFTEQVDQVAR